MSLARKPQLRVTVKHGLCLMVLMIASTLFSDDLMTAYTHPEAWYCQVNVAKERERTLNIKLCSD